MDETDCAFNHAESAFGQSLNDGQKTALRDNLGDGYTQDSLVKVIGQLGIWS